MKRIGRYELIRMLGVGAQGRVYEGVLHGPGGFRRSVAVKVLHGGDGLRREARIGGLLRHPNLVDVYEVGEQGGTWFCAMELCAGGSLSRHIPLSPRSVVEVGLQICAALQYAHDELGLVHLDLKPDNLLVQGAVVKVADLGIARAEGFEPQLPLRGTRGFMAPEQLRGEAVDARTDVFALGEVLQKLATGSTTRDATTIEADADGDEIAPPSANPVWLYPLINRMLEPDPRDRPQSMAEVAAALRQLEVSGRGLREALGVAPSQIPAADRRGTNLRPEPNRFVGRERDLAALEQLLAQPGTVLLRGPSGVGKTRLARTAALAYRARTGAQAWFCDLSEAQSLGAALQAIAATLSVPIDRGSQDAQIEQLGYALAARGPAVVVLDSSEQLGALLGRLSARAPQARLLATGREPLRDGEVVVPVEPLAEAEAVALLAARVLDRGHDVSEDGALVAIARALDGLPFALELAASRIGVLSPAEVLHNLSLSWLRSGQTERLERRETLRGMLSWSWDLLHPDEQRALAQLSVFRGGFLVDAAEAVLDLPGAPFALDLLQELIDRSWLGARDGRLRMLEPARTFAREQLDAADPAEARHGAWFALAGQSGAIAALDSPDGPELRRALAAELDNLDAACRSAVGRGDAEIAVSTCRAAWEVLFATGPIGMGAALAEAVLALPGLAPGPAARMARIAAQAYMSTGDVDQAERWYEAGLVHARAAGDLSREADLLVSLGAKRIHQGRFAEARPFLERGLSLHRSQRDRSGEARALSSLGLMLRGLGQLSEARAHYEQSLALHRAQGTRRDQGIVLGNLANLSFTTGSVEIAEALMHQALSIHRELGNKRSEGVMLGNLGTVYQYQDRLDLAERHHREALRIHQEVGFHRFQGLAHRNLATLLLARGDLAQARVEAEAALAIHQQSGPLPLEALALTTLAHLDAQEGDFERAQSRSVQALTLCREIGDPPELCRAVFIHGTVQAMAGDLQDARAHRDEGERIMQAMGVEEPSDLHRTLRDLEALIEERAG